MWNQRRDPIPLGFHDSSQEVRRAKTSESKVGAEANHRLWNHRSGHIPCGGWGRTLTLGGIALGPKEKLEEAFSLQEMVVTQLISLLFLLWLLRNLGIKFSYMGVY